MPITTEKPTSKRYKQANYELIRVNEQVCKVVTRNRRVFMGIVGGEHYCRARARERGFVLCN